MILKPKISPKTIHEAAKANTHKALEEFIESLEKQFDPFNENHPICFDEEDTDYVELLEDFNKDIKKLKKSILNSPNEYNKEKVDDYIKKAKAIYSEYAGVAESWLGGGEPMVWMSF